MRRLSATTIALAAAISLIACVGIGLALTGPLLSLEMERMGVSGTASGINAALAGFASILAAPYVTQVAARIGVGPLIFGALVLCCLAFIGFKLTMNYWAWMPLRFAYAIGLCTLFIFSEFWISSIAPADQRGLVMGIYATVLSLGFAIGPALLAHVGTTGWPPYLAGVGLMVLAGLPLLLARGHWPDVENRARYPLGSYILAAPLAAAAGFASGAIETGAISMLPVLGLRLGMEASTAALLVSVVALGNIVSQVPIGWLSDRLDRRFMLLCVAMGAVAASVMLTAVVQQGSLALYAVLMLWGGLTGAFYTLGLAHLSARFSLADLVGANAAFVVMFNVGLLAGPPAIGAGIDVSTRFGFALSTSVFALLVALIAIYEWRRPIARAKH